MKLTLERRHFASCSMYECINKYHKHEKGQIRSNNFRACTLTDQHQRTLYVERLNSSEDPSTTPWELAQSNKKVGQMRHAHFGPDIK